MFRDSWLIVKCPRITITNEKSGESCQCQQTYLNTEVRWLQGRIGQYLHEQLSLFWGIFHLMYLHSVSVVVSLIYAKNVEKWTNWWLSYLNIHVSAPECTDRHFTREQSTMVRLLISLEWQRDLSSSSVPIEHYKQNEIKPISYSTDF